jgi:regulator of RNase E activity RraA
LTPGKRLVGRARTLRFVPTRPDFVEEMPSGEEWLPYQAMALCKEGDVLVVDAQFHGEVAVAGDVMLLQLKIQNAEGIVTDGGIRDLEQITVYGIGVFAGDTTHRGAPPVIMPSDFNMPIQCGRALVRPGDVIVGDDNGVLVVSAKLAEEVIGAAEERERVEEFVVNRIQDEQCCPGKYYPITPATMDLYNKERGS